MVRGQEATRAAPGFTARQGWSRFQQVVFGGGLTLPVVGILLYGTVGLRWVIVSLSLAFTAIVAVKVAAIVAGFFGRHTLQVESFVVDALEESALPSYSVLVPLYKEPEVVPELLASLASLDYPRSKLEVLVLLEEDDVATADAFRERDEVVRSIGARVVVVPAGTPKTKPRACNHGLSLARGEYLVVYDAEDRPDRDQLKKAVAAFRVAGSRVACLQAKLNYYNFDQNLLTRLFTLEYSAWFDIYLPGLHALDAPIPLGGTSNHFRSDVLRRLGGWDAFNVTEDCDLGIRLARSGLDTRILDSTTWEEACSRVGPWLAQRSRWVKGYLQTFLVHTRELGTTIDDLGLKRTALMGLTVGGLVFSLVATLPSLGLIGLWLYTFATDPFWRPQRLPWAVSVSLLLFVGYFILFHMLAVHQRRRLVLVPYALLLPGYWMLMSIGALRGVLQFFVKPFHWEKTPHGLAPEFARRPATRTGVQRGSHPQAAYVRTDVAETLAPVVAQDESPREFPRLPRVRPRHLWMGGLATVVALAIALGPNFLIKEKSIGAREATLNLDQSWMDSTEVRVRLSLQADTKAELRGIAPSLVTFVKVHDGEWYERGVGSYSRTGRDGRVLEFSVDLNAPWQPVGHQRPWGRWCLRRVRQFGVRVIGEAGEVLPRPLVRSVEHRRGTIPQPIVYTIDRGLPERVATFRVHELRFSLNREWENPFDPEQVEFWGVFESPLGDRKRIPAFYTQDYTRQLVASPEQLTPTGPPGWALRFAATTPGLYRFHLEGEDRHGALGRSETLEVRADMSPGPGYVRVDPAQRYFVRDRGDFFYPIGINLRSPTDGGQANYDFEPPTNEEGASRLESYLARMKENGITLGRVWLTPWFGGIEWSRDAPGYHGLGQYNLQNAWRIDRLLQTAEELGVFIELLLYAHGPYQGDFIEPWGKLIDSQWADNPYNVKNGGPVPRPQEFLSNVGARKGARNYLRYVAARYGAHTQLFGWTLWNEVDTVTMDIPGIAEWHREMIEVLRDNDTGKHIVSTEFRKLGYPEIWGLPEIDYVQSEAYFHRGDGGLIARFREAREMLGRLGKPAVIEEYGGGWWGGSMDLLAQNIHDGLWAAWTEGFSSAPLAWWWNLIFEKRLDAYYRVFSEFTRGEDLRGPEFSRGSPSIVGANQLAALSNQNADRAYVWIYEPRITEQIENPPERIRQLFGGPKPDNPEMIEPLSSRFTDPDPLIFSDEVSGAELELNGLADGTYGVEIWDTWVLKPPTMSTLRVSRGRARWPIPATTRDLALKIKRTGS